MNVSKFMWFLGSGGLTPPEELGVLFNQATFPNIDNYTAYGTPTTSIVSNELNISGTGTFTKGIYRSSYGYTLLSDFYRKITYRVNTIIATQRGIVVGQVDPTPGTPARNIWAGMNVTTGGTKGYIYMWDQDVTILASSVTGITFAVNDIIQYEFSRSGWTYTLTVTNLTDSPLTNNLTINYNVTPTLSGNVQQYQSQFYLSVYGGATTWTVLTDYASSTAWKYANTCFVGDSKTEAIGVADLATAYPASLYSASSKKFVVEAKGNSTTQDILDAMNEILALDAYTYVLFIGCNDVRSGVASGTWQANYASIVSQLAATGARVILCRPAKEIGLDLSGLDTYIQTYSGTYTIIDLYTGWDTGTMLNADNIHPNATGQAYITTQLSSYVPN